MRHRWFFAMFFIALVGCQQPNPCRDLMRENFELNEYILQQEIHIDEQQREIDRLKTEVAAVETFEEGADQIEPPAVEFGDDPPPAFPRPGDPGNPLDDEVPPAPFNPNSGPTAEPIGVPQSGALNELELILPGIESRPGLPIDSATDIESISIDARRTRALNLDGEPGDDGLVVVFEPRDAKDQPLAALGPVTIVAVDPSLPDHLARVARWDYAEEEVRELLVQTRQGPKLVCQLLWPSVPPASSRLQLYVRMKTPEGNVQADVPLLADFAGIERDGQRFATSPQVEDAASPHSASGEGSTSSAPQEHRPLRRVSLRDEEEPLPQTAEPEPVRTSQRTPPRTPPPWSPVRN